MDLRVNPPVTGQGADQLHSRHALVPGSVRGARSPYIYAGEQEKPHDVNKVPVPGGEFKPQMLLGRELSGHGAHQAHDQENRPDDDMGAVESGRHEESGAVDMARIMKRGVHVFVSLDAGEREAEGDRKNETPFKALTIVMEQSVMRPGHRGAGSEQDQGVEQGQVPGIEGLDPFRWPYMADEIGAHYLVDIGRKQRG